MRINRISWPRYVLAAATFLSLASTAAAAPLSQVREERAPFPGATLYRPNDGRAHPGIVVLHGSEGGSLPYFKLEAQYLAAHGYAVLAYCWYNCLKDPLTGPMERLEKVELRTTLNAITWLKKSKAVGGHKVALLGFSRGAEQAVLLGAQRDAGPLLDAIAVHTPSDTVVQGFSWSNMDKRCWICASPDLACFNSTDDLDKWDWSHMRWNPACGVESNFPDDSKAWLLDGVEFKSGAVIEIEKFKKPVFVTVGDHDDLWDYHKSLRIADRLKQFGQRVELHVFPGEHHMFSYAGENARHEMLLNFFKRTL